MPPLKKGAYCFATLSVCRPSIHRSISFDPFAWSISNLVQGLPSISRWSLLIFRSHVHRSRSNHSFEPSVLSTLYILIPCLIASDRFCFYREDKPEFCTMGGHICFWNISCFFFKFRHFQPNLAQSIGFNFYIWRSNPFSKGR